jgi:hypothetical protein
MCFPFRIPSGDMSRSCLREFRVLTTDSPLTHGVNATMFSRQVESTSIFVEEMKGQNEPINRSWLVANQ